MNYLRFVCFVIYFLSTTLNSQTELPAFFGDNMVLQQNENISIWGKDLPGISILISSSWGEKTSTVVNSEGFGLQKLKQNKLRLKNIH